MKSIIFSHPTGNANVRAAVMGLVNSHQLLQFYTSIAVTPGSFISKAAGIGPLSELKRRTFDASLAPYITTKPWFEAGRMIASKTGLSKLTRHEKGIFSIDNVYKKLDAYVAEKLNKTRHTGAKAVYNYEDGASASFVNAKKLQLSCLYDLPIGYWRAMHRLLETEKTARPGWAATLTGFNDSAAKLARKDEELRLADHIFVASSFTAATLQDYPGKLAPVSIIPYGFPDITNSRTYQPLRHRPLKILFVGGLSQRKGIANLFEAVQPFGNRVALTVVGQKAAGNCNALNAALALHQWIPSLPHAGILQLMQQHDIFVFPSLFEGFGLVITEAMSQGTPVITTERTAGPDLIQHGKNGWLTAAGDTEALQAAIENILQQPQQIEQAGKAAMETARLRPWSIYGQELATTIEAVLTNR